MNPTNAAAIQFIQEQVTPVLEKAANWAVAVASGMMTLQVIYSLIINFIKGGD